MPRAWQSLDYRDEQNARQIAQRQTETQRNKSIPFLPFCTGMRTLPFSSFHAPTTLMLSDLESVLNKPSKKRWALIFADKIRLPDYISEKIKIKSPFSLSYNTLFQRTSPRSFLQKLRSARRGEKNISPITCCQRSIKRGLIFWRLVSFA